MASTSPTDYVAVLLSGFAGGILALGGSTLTWWLKDRSDRAREQREYKRSRLVTKAERLRTGYRTILLAVRGLQEVITRQVWPLKGDISAEQLRAVIEEIGGAATKDIRAAELELLLDGENTDLIHDAVSAYATFQLSLALPAVMPAETRNEQIQLLNEAAERLRQHALRRLQELEESARTQ